jgi:hypothetical protein
MLPTRPEGIYSNKNQSPEWQKFVWHLARWNLLQLREVAAMLGIPLATLKNGNHETILTVYRQGLAEAYADVNYGLLTMATADPDLTESPMERAQIRTLKLDALKVLSKTYEKRAEFDNLSAERDKDREIIKAMTTEELQDAARKLLK